MSAVLRELDDVVFEVIGAGLEMPLLSLGKFVPVRRKRAVGFNINTKEPVAIPAHNTVKFKASISLRRVAKKAKLP